MKVVQVPCLSDNYSYLLIDESSKTAAAVDPAGPAAMVAAAEKEGVCITHILTTHHHHDHSGGNEALVKLLNNDKLKVVGGDDRIPCMNVKVTHEDKFKVGNIDITTKYTPCHTTGHVLFFCREFSAAGASSAPASNPPPVLFSGDTLFVGGCGRFFEGTAAQMTKALMTVVRGLPHNTEVHCGHEYTVKNLEFALSLEPHNDALIAKMKWAQERRAANLSTVPSTIGEELKYNPFMRVDQESVAAAVGLSGSSPTAVMAAVRTTKDNFGSKL